jgi:hypothetical protein
VDAGEARGGILVARETCDEGEKTSVGCDNDFGCFRLILVVLEYAFQLISVWAMVVSTLPAPMTEILVWLLVGNGGVTLWSDREGEHRLIALDSRQGRNGGLWRPMMASKWGTQGETNKDEKWGRGKRVNEEGEGCGWRWSDREGEGERERERKKILIKKS